MNETLKLGLILFIITAISASVLSVSNSVTSERIAEADRIASQAAMQEMLNEAESFETLDENRLQEIINSNENILEINEGYDSSSSLVGYTFKVVSNGYDGEIEFMTGVSTDGYITGIKVLNHTETPGLGANATKGFFSDTFKDKPVGDEITAVADPQGDNEVQALTSATNTTDAIVEGVNMVREIYNSELAN